MSSAGLADGMLAAFAGEMDNEHQHGHKMKAGMSMEKKATSEKGAKQEKCPVMGGAIDSTVFVDHEGQRVYFCCESCKAEFNKDPAAYLAKMKKQGVQAEKTPVLSAQKTCPVTGDPIDSKFFVDAGGKRIYVCCPDCIDPVKKDPEKYIKILEERGEGVETISE
jgi:YHS domain-containing protein